LINFSFLAAHVIAFFIAVGAASLMVALKDSYDSSLLGIALTYALVIPYLSSMSAQSLTNMNMSFTSLERLLEYKQLPQEAPHSLPSDPPEDHWPSKAVIEFQDVQARYRPGLPLCLKGCSFTVRSGESIGIVGRCVCLYYIVAVEFAGTLTFFSSIELEVVRVA
jgi:ABC-type multidrug transport system fused ATPase/permease subunit